MSSPTSQPDSGQDLTVPNEERERPLRKRQRVHGEKLCQVCGDKASAHHFGTLACETCKAFFRRNAFSKRAIKCAFQEKCQVTILTRRFCPACRLKKCFDVGMRSDLILDDDEKKERMQKVNINRSKKNVQNSSLESDGSHVHSAMCSVTTTATDKSMEPEIAHSNLAQSPYPVTDVTAQQTWWLPVAEVDSKERMVAESLASSVGDQWNRTGIPVTFVSSSDGAASGSQWNTSDIPVVVVNSSASSSRSESQWNLTAAPMQAGQNFEMVISNPETMTTKTMCPKQDGVVPHSVDLSHPPPPAPPRNLHPPAHWQQRPSPSPSLSPSPAPSRPESTQLLEDLPPLSSSLIAQSQYISSFKHVPRDALPSDPCMYWRLSEEERCLLTQLSAAYQDTLLAILQGSPPSDFIPKENVTPEMYWQECECHARNAISFAKRMEDFRQLRTDEQIALLKASTNQVLGLRSCALYIVEKNAWLTRLGYFTLEHVLKLMPGHPGTDLSVTFCRSIKSIVKNDVTLYALLHCVMLFDPCDERVIDRQLINSIRDKYIILLRHYLQSLYSYHHSEKYLMALQGSLIFFRSICQEWKPTMKKFFPNVPNQLLVELMDWC